MRCRDHWSLLSCSAEISSRDAVSMGSRSSGDRCDVARPGRSTRSVMATPIAWWGGSGVEVDGDSVADGYGLVGQHESPEARCAPGLQDCIEVAPKLRRRGIVCRGRGVRCGHPSLPITNRMIGNCSVPHRGQAHKC